MYFHALSSDCVFSYRHLTMLERQEVLQAGEDAAAQIDKRESGAPSASDGAADGTAASAAGSNVSVSSSSNVNTSASASASAAAIAPSASAARVSPPRAPVEQAPNSGEIVQASFSFDGIAAALAPPPLEPVRIIPSSAKSTLDTTSSTKPTAPQGPASTSDLISFPEWYQNRLFWNILYITYVAYCIVNLFCQYYL